MRFDRWWHYGLLGGATLALATLGKIAQGLPALIAGEVNWAEAVEVLVAVSVIGFVCGVIVWIGRGLPRRFGHAGDALVGLAVGLALFGCCMLLSAPRMFGERLLIDGLPMLGAGGAIGTVAGVCFGHNFREAPPKSKRERRPCPEDDSGPSSTR